MSLFRLIIVSFLHHWRMNLAVALGAAVGTAVLTGALLVGDSMRGSLRSLALDRLGKIDEVLVPGRFFREKLADELKETDDYKAYGKSLVPAILLPASMENPETQTRANRVEVIGCNQYFFDLFPYSPGTTQLPQVREIVLNQPLAEKLGVKPGDAVILRLPRPGSIPSDSALGEKRNTVESHRLIVREILPAAGPGRFSLKPNQQEPLNAYVPLEWLQERLEQVGKVNSLLLALNEEGKNNLEEYHHPRPTETGFSFHDFYVQIKDRLTGNPPVHYSTLGRNYGHGESFLEGVPFIELEDYGVHCTITPHHYINVTSDEMILGNDIEYFASLKAGHDKEYEFQPIFTYLANRIVCNGREIPYSTITALDLSSTPPLGPFLSTEGPTLKPLVDDEIALNAWAADDLKAKIGDTITITYFEPESIHGQIRERTAKFKLAAIVQITGAAADRTLTPAVKGIADELTMANWDPPFPFDAKRIRPEDEKYWNEHGPTPKAFISSATGRELWGSRFGRATSLRVASKKNDLKEAESDLRLMQNLLDYFIMGNVSRGFKWQPIRLQGLAAAEGTTPFNVLFLGFSFFIIVSALMLVLLLFKLGVERRAAEIGILLAVGWKPRQVRKLLFSEGVLIALAGGVIGVPLGIGYAAIMLWGLSTWWLAAIVTPFLELFITPSSLMIGFFAGLFMAIITILFAVRKISRIAPRQLLAGQVQKESRFLINRKTIYRLSWIEIIWLMFFSNNLLLWFFAKKLSGLEAGLFFGCGSLMLLLTLLVIWSRLRRGATGAAVAVGGGNLFRLAMRNAARNPGRSTLTVGLVASACFLIASVSAFQLDPSQQTPDLKSGNGGFALAAESSQPIFQNLDSPDGRAALGFSDNEEKILSQCHIYSLRVHAGDDASCLNLYKPRSPRILGVPDNFSNRGGFAWADSPFHCKDNAWPLLENSGKHIPMILEKNTANYSLNLWGGLGEIYEYRPSPDKGISLEVVALLDNSIFQGDLLISEDALLKQFPETSGYRFFLVECPPERTAEVHKILENRLGDYGLTAETTGRRLARFLAVQNTYLSTFQSLGGLGLLLGTLGLAAVQLRNILERRGELALLRAVGFRRRKIALLVFLENAVLLGLGLGSGILAATIAVMPHFLTSNVSPPWFSLIRILGLVLLVGILAGFVAGHQILKTPLLNAIREEK